MGGCLVPFRLDGNLLSGFRNGYTAELTLTTLDGTFETVAILLLDFTLAFQALQTGG
jgi:invasion protein IalB